MSNSDIQGQFQDWISYCLSRITYFILGYTAYTSSHELEYVTRFTIKSKNISIYIHFWKLRFQHYSYSTYRYKGSGTFQTIPMFNLWLEWRILMLYRTLNEAVLLCTVLFPKIKPGTWLWHSHFHIPWIPFYRSKVESFLNKRKIISSHSSVRYLPLR